MRLSYRLLFFLLLLFSSTVTFSQNNKKKYEKEMDKLNCIKKPEIGLDKRLVNYPYNLASQIKIVTYKDKEIDEDEIKMFSQNEKTGKVRIVKSQDSKDKIIMSLPDNYIKLLNESKHTILIFNKQDSLLTTTDTLGIFKIPEKYFDYCNIIVNQESKLLRGSFLLMDGLGQKDSIVLKIDDHQLAVFGDSIQAPEFYKNYKN